jgi:hypothetical protein
VKYYFYTLEVIYPNWVSRLSLIAKGASIGHILKTHIDTEEGRQCTIIFAEEITRKAYDDLEKKEWFS